MKHGSDYITATLTLTLSLRQGEGDYTRGRAFALPLLELLLLSHSNTAIRNSRTENSRHLRSQVQKNIQLIFALNVERIEG